MHSAISRTFRTGQLILAAVAMAAPAWAAYPTFTTTKPNGAQRGTETQLVVTGSQLDDFEGFVFMSPGFTLKKVDKVTPAAVTTTIAIAPDVPLGNHMIRIRTKTGLSHARQFFVGQYPNVEEKEPNDDFNTPQVVGFNQTIEGIVKSEDVDYYRLTAKKGQRIAIEIDGLRLGYTN
ncbi:MAG: putative serine proteinase, subtilase family, partial [Verrucomicrobiaceae bacterium]|nr:putative serine proteinase, subtilase family [Verrucomicrobiaceae bacterium]